MTDRVTGLERRQDRAKQPLGYDGFESRTKRPVDKKAVGQKGRRKKGRGTGRPAFLTPLGHEG